MLALTLYLFPLQTTEPMSYFKEDNPRQAMIVGIGFGVLILIAILVHIIRHGVSSSVTGKARTNVTPRKFNAFTLHRIAAAYGLDRNQTKLLEYVFRNDAVGDPERVMRNPALLDRHFKRAYKSIEKNSETEEDLQQRLVNLFALRNHIEAAPGTEGTPSGQLATNTPAVLGLGKDSFPVRVLSSQSQHVITEIPRNTLGTPIRVSKGTRITLSFFTKSSKGFSFDGHVAGLVDTGQGPALQITHTGKVKALANRRFRRKQTSIRCEFFNVFLEETGRGRKKVSRLVVDNRKFTGTILDVSIGGCSLKTSAPILVGSRLKITIDYDDDYFINVLGQVLRANRSAAAGTIIHIKFLKVPRRAFNSISALVFGYNED